VAHVQGKRDPGAWGGGYWWAADQFENTTPVLGLFATKVGYASALLLITEPALDFGRANHSLTP
jgi:hypothetical protein